MMKSYLMKITTILLFIVLLFSTTGCDNQDADEETTIPENQRIITEDLSGKPGRILIMGNSFVGTSSVDFALRRLVEENGEDLEVETVSEGYANIGSLAAHLETNPGIKEGLYDAIFLCGVYGSDIDPLKDYLDAVKDTKTKIILFPASNESPSDIIAAREKYPGTGYVGWLDIVSELFRIEYFRLEAFVFMDEHLHLNEIGGYAGALMIYNYLYREAPKTEESEEYYLSSFGDLLQGRRNETGEEILKKISVVATELITAVRTYNGKPITK